jgi:hypothetical protein
VFDVDVVGHAPRLLAMDAIALQFAAEDNERYDSGHATAAVLIFFSAPAGAWFVAANFWY